MGKTCAFTGHRPEKLYGYEMDERYNNLLTTMKDTIVRLIEECDVDTFISGGALGTDTLAFMIVHSLKKNRYPHIKNILAIPFLHQDCKWFGKNLTRYLSMKKVADSIVYVDTLDAYRNTSASIDTYAPSKMQDRNKYMVDNSDYLIAVYNGTKGGTHNCIKYAESKDVEIIKIDII